jgi:hypothetical protein
MKGRKGSEWQDRFNTLDGEEIVKAASSMGFEGIYLDRYGYADSRALEDQIARALKVPPVSDRR